MTTTTSSPTWTSLWTLEVSKLAPCIYSPYSTTQQKKATKGGGGGGGGGEMTISRQQQQSQKQGQSQKRPKVSVSPCLPHLFQSIVPFIGQKNSFLTIYQKLRLQTALSTNGISLSQFLSRIITREMLGVENETISSIIEYYRTIADDVRKGVYDRLIEEERTKRNNVIRMNTIKVLADSIYRRLCSSSSEPEQRPIQIRTLVGHENLSFLLGFMAKSMKPTEINISLKKKKPWTKTLETPEFFSTLLVTVKFPQRIRVMDTMSRHFFGTGPMVEMIPSKMVIFMNGRNIFPEGAPPHPPTNQKMIEYRDKDDTPLYGDTRPPSQQQLRSHTQKLEGCFLLHVHNPQDNFRFGFGPDKKSINTAVNFIVCLFRKENLLPYFTLDKEFETVYYTLFQKFVNVEDCVHHPLPVQRVQQMKRIYKNSPTTTDVLFEPFNTSCINAMLDAFGYLVSTYLVSGIPIP
jgi:hypothetical protein